MELQRRVLMSFWGVCIILALKVSWKCLGVILWPLQSVSTFSAICRSFSGKLDVFGVFFYFFKHQGSFCSLCWVFLLEWTIQRPLLTFFSSKKHLSALYWAFYSQTNSLSPKCFPKVAFPSTTILPTPKNQNISKTSFKVNINITIKDFTYSSYYHHYILRSASYFYLNNLWIKNFLYANLEQERCPPHRITTI